MGWQVGWGGGGEEGGGGHETGIPDQEAAQAAQVARMLRARVLLLHDPSHLIEDDWEQNQDSNYPC